MTIHDLIQIIVPISGFIIAVVSASLSYYFTKKQQILADERRLKEKCYLEFIEALSYNVLTDDIEIGKNKLSEAHNQILLIGDAKVVQTLREYTLYISPVNAKKISQEKHDELITNLIQSMRIDLYNKKNINKGYPTIGIPGKNRR